MKPTIAILVSLAFLLGLAVPTSTAAPPLSIQWLPHGQATITATGGTPDACDLTTVNLKKDNP